MNNSNSKQLALLVLGVLIAFALYYSFAKKMASSPAAPTPVVDTQPVPADQNINTDINSDTSAPAEDQNLDQNLDQDQNQTDSPTTGLKNTSEAASTTASTTASTIAASNQFIETIDFKTLPQATIRQSRFLYEEQSNLCNAKPVVVEFFSYGCPGCAQADPYFKEWKKNNNHIEFMKIPVAIHDPNNTFAKVFYTNRALGIHDERIDSALFNLGTNPNNRVDLDAIVAELKNIVPTLDETSYKNTYNNIPVSMINKGNALFHQYRLPGTPSVVVNNKYVIKLNSYGRMFETIDYLTQKENTSCPTNGNG